MFESYVWTIVIDVLINFLFSDDQDLLYLLADINDKKGIAVLADLIAYPISQHLLYPDRVNFAYDIIKNNIYESEGKKLGLKVIPHLEEEQQKKS